MKTKKILPALICMLLIAVITVSSSIAVTGTAIAKTASNQTEKGLLKPDKKYKKAQADFSVELFQKTLKKGKNTLISPSSVMYTMAMTANGAGGKTQKEMEKVLGNGISVKKLNKYLGYSLKNLQSTKNCKMNIANSIWYNSSVSDLTIKKSFLKNNANYYNANIFSDPFDNSTVGRINNWVKESTDNMIKKIINNIDEENRMFLINAIAFDGKWSRPYTKNQVEKRSFTSYNGKKNKVEMLNDYEYTYIKDNNAKGFIKDYKGGRYSFAAILPNKGVDIYKYANSLTGDKLIRLLKNRSNEPVVTAIPKFKYDYSKSFKKVLTKMGIKKAFDVRKANFKNMADYSPDSSLYISDVFHKTHIELNESGTKAAAVTMAVVGSSSCASSKLKKVILNRPFIYMIVDNKTNLPVFMGTIIDLK